MAKAYRQNTKYEKITDDDGQEEDKSHGNTGLPFGLCKKYGISLPDNATPRMAWDVLKGKGIYPPWTEKGKDQYKGKGEETQEETPNGSRIEIDAERKQIYDHIRDKLGKFSQEYREALEKHLEIFDDNEIAAISATIGKINFADGSGAFNAWFGRITTPGKKLSDIDKEMGNEFGATSFFHEYGHYLADELGKRMKSDVNGGKTGNDFNNLPEFQQIFAEDAQEFFDTACQKAGLKGKFNLNRILREQKEAVWSYLAELTEKGDYKAATNEPQKPFVYIQDRESIIAYRVNYLGDSRERAEAYADEQVRKAEADYKAKYEEYKAALERHNTLKDRATELSANFQRWGFLTDFIGGATHGKLDVYNSGYYGHPFTYWTGRTHYGVKFPGQKNGVETWAEYVSFKMTKDNKGLDMFKRTLPRTFAKYEEVYSKMGGILKDEKD